jgi:type IV secretory pathway VirB4 component
MSIFNLLENNKVRKPQNQYTLSTESLFQFTEIRGGTIVLKDGGLRSIIKVEGINLDLRSYEEQVQIIEQYKRFLNALDFPIQIIVHNSYLDLSDYINLMKDQVEKIANPTLASYGEEYISFMDAINTKE